VNDYKWEIEMVPLHLIFVDGELQRPEQPSHIKKMAAEWNELGAQIPALSGRDSGYYHAMDGQHTVKTRVARGETEVRAQVYYGLTREEEALCFAIRNGERKAVNNIYKHRVSVKAGMPVPVALDGLLSQWGWEVAPSGSGFASVVQLRKVAEGRGGFTAASNAIETITRTWGTNPAGAHQNIIAGLGVLYSKCDINVDLLVRRLKGVFPDVIHRNARALTTGTTQVKYANAILGLYNKGTRKVNQIPDLVRA
jgi:hypothetical protein